MGLFESNCVPRHFHTRQHCADTWPPHLTHHHNGAEYTRMGFVRLGRADEDTARPHALTRCMPCFVVLFSMVLFYRILIMYMFLNLANTETYSLCRIPNP